MKLHRFFNHFHMSLEDFDSRGNIRFNDGKPPQNDRRGGWPYYPPVRCKRYGIRVSGKYDDKKIHGSGWMEVLANGL